MGDSSSEMSLDLQRAHELWQVDELVDRRRLYLNKDSIPWITNHIDYFVSQSRENKTVKRVYLYLYSLNGQDDDFWDKVGQAIGNFQELKRLHVYSHKYYHTDDDEQALIPNWKILARILSHVRQRITFSDISHSPHGVPIIAAWRSEDCRSVARAIYGHPTITCFEGGSRFCWEASDALYSALATLPALESVTLSNRGCLLPRDEPFLANPESLTELLRVPTLRSVWFYSFSFKPALCQATANALMKGTMITKLAIDSCSFSAAESTAIMANCLARNTSLVRLAYEGDVMLGSALATALQSNSTLRDISFTSSKSISAVFLALGKNTGVKVLKIRILEERGEAPCTSIKNGLGMNESLEILELVGVSLSDDNAELWCRAFSFLRTNKALRFMVVVVKDDATNSCISAFRVAITAMLEENTSLESLSIRKGWEGMKIKVEEYFVYVTALQHNKALKSLNFYCGDLTIRLTDNEDKQMAALLEKNYTLENLPDLDLDNEVGDVRAILRLNKAGRRYLVQDGSSIPKGVEVLIRVNNDINCVFLHLSENPRLCDRRAIEVASTSTIESN
jgi:hypothetical protein